MNSRGARPLPPGTEPPCPGRHNEESTPPRPCPLGRPEAVDTRSAPLLAGGPSPLLPFPPRNFPPALSFK
jgi:hypothetical protein